MTPNDTTHRSDHSTSTSINTPKSSSESTTKPVTTSVPANHHDNQRTFETKYQLLHRIQEGIDFQDGNMYTSTEYIKMAHQQTLQYKNMKYPLHDLLSKYHHRSNTNNSKYGMNNYTGSDTITNSENKTSETEERIMRMNQMVSTIITVLIIHCTIKQTMTTAKQMKRTM